MRGADATWRIALTVPNGTGPVFSQALEELASALSAFELAEGGPWRIEALTEAEPDRAEVAARLALAATTLGLPAPDVVVAPLPRQDWVAINQASFKPLRIGRFVVRPGHAAPPPGVRFPIVLDAGVAFGTGEHATTQGCLLALDALARAGVRPRRILDLGCGTGILAIAAAKLWPGTPRIAARDIDADAVRMTQENARANAVRARIVARRSHGDAGVGRGLDLVIANILARPLVHLAGGIARLLRPGGRVVLAGLLVDQERDVLHAYRTRGLRLVARRRISGWSILALRRPQKQNGGP